MDINDCDINNDYFQLQTKENHMCKAIFIDIDGTLKNNTEISKRTISVIKKVVEKGILVILCSGRPRQYVENISRKCYASTYIISSNGGVIYDYKKNKILYKSAIKKHACMELYKISEEFNTTFIMDIEGMQVVNKLEKCNSSKKVLDTNIKTFLSDNNIMLCTIKDENF